MDTANQNLDDEFNTPLKQQKTQYGESKLDRPKLSDNHYRTDPPKEAHRELTTEGRLSDHYPCLDDTVPPPKRDDFQARYEQTSKIIPGDMKISHTHELRYKDRLDSVDGISNSKVQ